MDCRRCKFSMAELLTACLCRHRHCCHLAMGKHHLPILQLHFGSVDVPGRSVHARLAERPIPCVWLVWRHCCLVMGKRDKTSFWVYELCLPSCRHSIHVGVGKRVVPRIHMVC